VPTDSQQAKAEDASKNPAKAQAVDEEELDPTQYVLRTE
jgi:hypothetical protein